MKTMILAASLAAALLAGCADLGATTSSAGASAQTDTRVNQQSPYPARTDQGLF